MAPSPQSCKHGSRSAVVPSGSDLHMQLRGQLWRRVRYLSETRGIPETHSKIQYAVCADNTGLGVWTKSCVAKNSALPRTECCLASCLHTRPGVVGHLLQPGKTEGQTQTHIAANHKPGRSSENTMLMHGCLACVRPSSIFKGTVAALPGDL